MTVTDPLSGIDATRGARLGAAAFDSILVLLAALPILLHSTGEAAMGSLSAGLMYVLSLVAIALVQLVFLTRDGQTIGKKVVGIRIVKIDTGANGGFVTNVLLRSGVSWVLAAFPGYALADPLFILRADRRCLHDHIAGTRVVEAETGGEPLA